MSVLWDGPGPGLGRKPRGGIRCVGRRPCRLGRQQVDSGATVKVPPPSPPVLHACRVLLVDNYDSFTWNLAHDLGRTGADVRVHRNDMLSLSQAIALQPTHIVLSPGPGRPERDSDFGVCKAILEHFHHCPILGVCLGHQGMAWQLGARVVHAPKVMHGKTSPILHDGTGVFTDLPSPFDAMRYHSLIVDRHSLPDCLRITAETPDGLVMGIVHQSRPHHGVQFHPESVGTPWGRHLIRNFLAL